MDISELYRTQIGLSEWLEAIGHSKTTSFREEDNKKRERLKILNTVIGLPFDEPTQFPATAVAHRTPDFQKFISEHGHELCALRLIPLDPALPKLRMRGQTIRDVAYQWFFEQKIDPTNYKADFVPHTEESRWSTIFVVNDQGIFGEIIRGGHHQLTQGFYEKNPPVTFSFDWSDWHTESTDGDIIPELKKITDYLKVADEENKKNLQTKVEATFAHSYLKGYFETVSTENFGIWFIDYNRILGQMYHNFSISHKTTDALLFGQIGNKGKVRGMVRIVASGEIAATQFLDNEILVCDMTTPEYINSIIKAAGVITERGGILSHAAIVCRELNKPCILGAKNATTVLKTGDTIELDADTGSIRIISVGLYNLARTHFIRNS
jgi:phosphohistidine swiveling domain-containing protein